MISKQVYNFAKNKFNEDLDLMLNASLIVLPINPEGEEKREYLINYQHDKKGNLIHQSVYRYGAKEINFEYKNDLFLAILVNND